MFLMETEPKIEVDITLPQQAYAIFESLNYTPWNAVGEFVDNSIQSYLNNKAKIKKIEKDYKLRIDIKLDPTKLEISDNASGIDEGNLKKGLKPATKPDVSDGLSEFGMGMKTGAFWLCRKWEIISKHFESDKEFTVGFDNVKIYTKDIRRIIVYPRTLNNAEHYTKLILKDLVIDGTNETIVEELKEHLASMYRYYIRDNEIEIYFNDEKLNFKKYEILRGAKAYGDNKEIDWTKKIEFTLSSGKKVTGFAGLLEIGKPTKAGFTYLRRNRVIEGLIEGVKIIDVLGTANLTPSQRVFAELNLDSFPVTHTKDHILFGNEKYEFWAKLKGALEEGDIKLLTQATKFSYKDKVKKKSCDKKTEKKSGEKSSQKQPQAEKIPDVLEININDFEDSTIEVTGSINKFSGEMKEAYENMYKIENVLRILIRNIELESGISFLKEDDYPEVDDKNIIRNINNNVNRIKKDETEKGFVSIRGKHDLYYTNFNALKSIIDLNWDGYFCNFFVIKKHVLDMLDRLYTYRNNIAHNSYLSEEERNHINIALQFFLKQLNGKINFK